MNAPGGRSLLLAIVAAFALGGCARFTAPVRRTLGLSRGTASRISKDELAREVSALATRFILGVVGTADHIAEVAPADAQRRNTLLWKLRIVPLAQAAADNTHIRGTYVALLTLASSQRQYLETGAGRTLFGEQQPLAVATAKRLEQDVVAVGASFLDAEALARVRAQVQEVIDQHPIRGVFDVQAAVAGLSEAREGNTFGWIFAIPMAPFRALEGVDTGAQAIQEFNRTARNFSDVVARLPEMVRWETELFLMNSEATGTVSRFLGAFELLSQSANQLSAAAEHLPTNLGLQASALVRQIDASQSELQTTLGQTQKSLSQLDAVLVRATSLSDSLLDLSRQTERTGKTWRSLVTELRTPTATGKSPAAENGSSFDVTEYTRAARQIQDAATELRSLVSELKGTHAAMVSLLDAAFWRVLALLAAFFALRLVFQWLGPRRERSKGGP